MPIFGLRLKIKYAMHTYTRLLVTLSILYSIHLSSQSRQGEAAIQSVIERMFEGMRMGDSAMISGLFTPNCVLSSIMVDSEGRVIKKPGPIQGFIAAVGTPHDKVWDERIWSYDIKIDGPMAQVWTEYTFYLGDDLSHCGVNVFELIDLQDGWKISQITDTRRKDGCITKSRDEVDLLMDKWHQAAAAADEEIFFGSMTADGIYIGTDATERWTRDEMKEWSQPYFNQESAWSFRPISRQISFDKAEQIGWFDELLDTWMGTCRASGVVVRTDEGWRIKHYHLSIAVPNDKVDGYLQLIGKPRKK